MITVTDAQGLIRIPDNKYADENIVRSYKARQIEIDKPVLVYRNLNKGGYSIKQNGLVVAHAERFCLGDFVPVVSESGRQKVINTGIKNVHAYLKGIYRTNGMGTTAARNDLQVSVKYNPFKYPFFYSDFINLLKIKGGMFCILDSNGIKAAYTYTEKL